MRYKRPHFSTRLVLETSSFEEASCDVMRGPHGEGHVTSNCRWLLADAKNLETHHSISARTKCCWQPHELEEPWASDDNTGLVHTLISVLWDLYQRTQLSHVWTSDPHKLGDHKWVLSSVAKLVVLCYQKKTNTTSVYGLSPQLDCKLHCWKEYLPSLSNCPINIRWRTEWKYLDYEVFKMTTKFLDNLVYENWKCNNESV